MDLSRNGQRQNKSKPLALSSGFPDQPTQKSPILDISAGGQFSSARGATYEAVVFPRSGLPMPRGQSSRVWLKIAQARIGFPFETHQKDVCQRKPPRNPRMGGFPLVCFPETGSASKKAT